MKYQKSARIVMALMWLFIVLAWNVRACEVRDPDIAGSYEGGCENGFAQGYGKAQGRDLYEGTFNNGLEDGQGKYTWVGQSPWQGDVYDGDWVNGKKNGHAVYTHANGQRYEGEYRDDLPNGHGIVTNPDGTRCEAEFRDQMNGHGICTYPDGTRREGVIVNGEFVGLTLDFQIAKTSYKIGESISISVVSNQPCYLTLYDISTEGDVVQLVPSQSWPNNYGTSFTIPSTTDPNGLQIAGPPGKEGILAIGTIERVDLVDQQQTEQIGSFRRIRQSADQFKLSIAQKLNLMPRERYALNGVTIQVEP